MLGRVPGFGVANAVLIDGADGSEKRVDDAAGERWSRDCKEEEERTEKRGWAWGYDMAQRGYETRTRPGQQAQDDGIPTEARDSKQRLY